MSYRTTVPSALASLEDLKLFVMTELAKVERDGKVLEVLELANTASAPVKPRNGYVVFTDGTAWNPGSGAGYYGYYGGAWVKLG